MPCLLSYKLIFGLVKHFSSYVGRLVRWITGAGFGQGAGTLSRGIMPRDLFTIKSLAIDVASPALIIQMRPGPVYLKVDPG